MTQSQDHIQRAWTWIRGNLPSGPSQYFAVTTQSIFGNEDLPYSDAMWRLAMAGILRPDGVRQFTPTEWGQQVIKADVSPYVKHTFVKSLDQAAPDLDKDTRAYLALALDCVYGVPEASIALMRVALEAEIGSLIDKFVRLWNPSPAIRKKLSSRDLSIRAKELVSQLEQRGILRGDDNVQFESCINLIRIEGNRVLHPKGGMPEVNPLFVQSVSYAFRVFAEEASRLKASKASKP